MLVMYRGTQHGGLCTLGGKTSHQMLYLNLLNGALLEFCINQCGDHVGLDVTLAVIGWRIDQ